MICEFSVFQTLSMRFIAAKNCFEAAWINFPLDLYATIYWMKISILFRVWNFKDFCSFIFWRPHNKLVENLETVKIKINFKIIITR